MMDVDGFFQALGRLFGEGQTDRVPDFLRQSLVHALSENDHYAAITVLNEMVGYFRSTSDFGQAVDAADATLSLMRRMGFERTIPYGTTLLNAATAYKASGNTARALELFSKAVGIYREQLPDTDPRLAGLYNNRSAVYQEMGNYGQARSDLEQAAAILSKVPGADIDLATVYTNLALVLSLMREDERAVATLRQALDIFEREGAADPEQARKTPHYAAALSGLAGLHLRAERFTQAVECYEAALARIKECFGENKDYAITCRNCAQAYEALGKSVMASRLKKQAEAVAASLGLG